MIESALSMLLVIGVVALGIWLGTLINDILDNDDNWPQGGAA